MSEFVPLLTANVCIPSLFFNAPRNIEISVKVLLITSTESRSRLWEPEMVSPWGKPKYAKDTPQSNLGLPMYHCIDFFIFLPYHVSICFRFTKWFLCGGTSLPIDGRKNSIARVFMDCITSFLEIVIFPIVDFQKNYLSSNTETWKSWFALKFLMKYMS